MSLTEGQTICNGKYKILRLIGEGGQSRVWLAREVARDLEVAIKEPLESLSPRNREELEERFQREMRISGQLLQREVPNVVRVFTVEEHEGQSLLVMDYCGGGSLADRLEKRPLPVDEALRITLSLCRALSVVHERLGLVHRDIKPSNILIAADGEAKLGDFGSAQTGESQRSALAGEFHPGTPGYMSPEQEQSRGYLTPASDLYALGCVLFEMLTGKRYQRQRRGTLPSQLGAHVPSWLDAVVGKALQPDPWDRYETAADLTAALRAGQDERRSAEQAAAAKAEAAAREEQARARAEAERQARAEAELRDAQAQAERERQKRLQAEAQAEAERRRRLEQAAAGERRGIKLDTRTLGAVALGIVGLLAAFVVGPRILGPGGTPIPTPQPPPQATSVTQVPIVRSPMPTKTAVPAPTHTPTSTPTRRPTAVSSPTSKPSPTRSATPLAQDRLVLSAMEEKGGRYQLYVMDADGTVARLASSQNDLWPSWSPDGQQIVFESFIRDQGTANNDNTIMLIRPDGTGRTAFGATQPGADGMPAWSPDGAWISFSSKRNNDIWQIFAANSRDGSGLRQLTSSQHANLITCWTSWAQDSRTVAYMSDWGSQDWTIHSVTLDGTVRSLGGVSGWPNAYPQCSPDGQHIVVVAYRSGDDHEIYLLDSRGQSLANLSDSPAKDRFPCWSPDSRTIIFWSNRVGDGRYRLYAVDTDNPGAVSAVPFRLPSGQTSVYDCRTMSWWGP